MLLVKNIVENNIKRGATMEKYKELSEHLLKNLGGADNLVFVKHCATRIRINYNNKSLINEEALKETPDARGVVFKQGQIQVIIGPDVNDAYNEFLKVSGWSETENLSDSKKVSTEDHEQRNIAYWLNKFGDFVAPIFMPIVPAMITGGLILAIKNLLVNYFGFSTDGGTAQIMLAIFDAGFTFLPVYVGYSLARQLKMQPIMGAFLGALLISSKISGVEGLDFFGITIPQVSYGSTIIPAVLGVTLMYWVDKGLKKIIPEALVFFLKPLLTMIVVTPITLIILGPMGTQLSGYIATFAVWLTDTLGFIAQPILAIIYPYMVMLGLDKTLSAIALELIANLGYNSVTASMGFISNLCIGGTALAVATSMKDKGKKGIMTSSGITALCGVTEPAFYGGLISRPKTLIGTAIGAAAGGLIAGIFGLRAFVQGGCPGLLTLLFFVDQDGSLHYVFVAALVAVVSVAVSFIATKIIISRDKEGIVQSEKAI